MNARKQSSLFVFERLTILFIIFSASGVTTFARSSMTWAELAMPIALLLLTLFIAARYQIALSTNFLKLIVGFVAVFIGQSFVFGSFHAKHLILYPLNFWISYCIVSAMRERFFFHIEFLITRLAAISFVIWLADLFLIGGIRNSLSGVVFGRPYNRIVDSYVFFQTFINEHVDSFVARNAGFAWEPGAFAVFCCLGLMANFYRTKFSLKQNRGALILIAAILSSQSTTGYSILVVFIILKLWRDTSGGLRFLVFPAVAASFFGGMISLPFMQDKIRELWAQDLSQLTLISTADWNISEPVAAQRFLSFQIDFYDFLNNPLTGYGGEHDEMMVRKLSLNIVSISGIGKILASFGLFGFIFFTWSTLQSSFSISRGFSVSSPGMLVAYIFLVSVSYSLVEHPLFIAFWCFGYFRSGGIENLQFQKRFSTL